MYYSKEITTPHQLKAENLFLSGYNCAQSVFAAFAEEVGLDVESAAKMASALGGGMCGARSVCGAFTGMLLVLGCLEGYSVAGDYEGKVALYKTGKALTDELEDLLGSRICLQLLKELKLSATPQKRNAEYYKKRPCVRFIGAAANILDGYLSARGGVAENSGENR